MSNSSLSLINTVALTENLLSINAAIVQSYTSAKRQLQDGATLIKEEFLEIYDKAGTYFNKMALPVNNFLKDLTQMDAEFQYELQKEIKPVNTQTCSSNIVPIEQALAGFMEENY